MNLKKYIAISDFDYNLPAEKIAAKPTSIRSDSKLLYCKIEQQQIEHHKFYDIVKLIPDGSFVLANNTKVLRARIIFNKNSALNSINKNPENSINAQVQADRFAEIFLLEPVSPSIDPALTLASKGKCSWQCMVGKLSKRQISENFTLSFGLNNNLADTPDLQNIAFNFDKTSSGNLVVNFEYSDQISFSDVLESIGSMPLPPYIKRTENRTDALDYQTVFAENIGAVAAPTAGLHFSEDIIQSLKQKNILFDNITLHVGAGTFAPVKTDNIFEHKMHSETIMISRKNIENYLSALEQRKNIYFVGTTTLRTMESFCIYGFMRLSGESFFVQEFVQENESKKTDGNNFPNFLITQDLGYKYNNFINSQNTSVYAAFSHLLNFMKQHNLSELCGRTSLMITPEYKIKTCKGLITNFHQPKSTLLMLVESMLGGNGYWKKVYQAALENDYRFLSYGDSSLLVKE